MKSSKYDVIVVGLGCAGALAAIAAGRQGAKVLALEKNTYPGGTQTGGGVNSYYGDGKPHGLAAELEDKAMDKINSGDYLGMIEVRKLVIEQEALAVAVEIHYQATVYEVSADVDTVRGIKWCDNRGIHHIDHAQFVIDATADAIVCRLAGCAMIDGREQDGLYNPFTNIFLARDANHVGVMNFDAGRINQYHAESFSNTLLESGKMHLLDTYISDGRERHRIMPSDIAGIREGQHIVAEFQFCLKDFFDKDFRRGETIAYARSNLDTHATDMPLESDILQDWIVAASMWGTELWFPIDRRSLIPKGKKGLIVAGRHLGVDHDVGYAVRMNGHMNQVGEAAGIMAALAAKQKGVEVLSLPLTEILKRMQNIQDPLNENDAIWNLNEQEIIKGLSSNTPGCAIWSARKKHKTKLLRQCFTQAAANSNLRRHSAMALALLDDAAGLEELGRMVSERDPWTPETSRKFNHSRGYASIYLLGRLRARRALGLLKNILSDYPMEQQYEYHTHAVTALIKIGQKHYDLRPDIAQTLRGVAENPEWKLMGRLKGSECFYRADIIFRIKIAVVLQEWNITNNIATGLKHDDLNAHDRLLAKKQGVFDRCKKY